MLASNAGYGIIGTRSAHDILIYRNDVTIATVSSTGLAVTGALSCTTGANFATSSGSVGISTTSWSLNSVSNKVGIRLSGTDGDGIGLFSLQNTANKYVTIGCQYDGSNTNNGSQVRFGIDAAGDTYSMLAFATANGSTPVERMRIDKSGNVCIGTTSSSNTNSNSIYALPALGAFVGQHDSSTASGTAYYAFNYNATQIGSITQTGTTAVLYNTTSDYRRKSNIQDLVNSGTFIDALKPRTFEWETGDKGVGFIAHEFSQVSPSSVNGEKDAVDGEGKPVYQSMQASSAEVIANLVAELQSLRKRLAAIEAK